MVQSDHELQNDEQVTGFNIHQLRDKVMTVVGDEFAAQGAPDHRELVQYIDSLVLESVVENGRFAVYGASCAVQAMIAMLKCFGVSTKNDTNTIQIGFSGRLPRHLMAFETAKSILPLLNTLSQRQMGPAFEIFLDGQMYRPRDNQ